MRATPSSCIWQCYHVETEEEERTLTANARDNGFHVETQKHDPSIDETWPGWRETELWKKCPKK